MEFYDTSDSRVIKSFFNEPNSSRSLQFRRCNNKFHYSCSMLLITKLVVLYGTIRVSRILIIKLFKSLKDGNDNQIRQFDLSLKSYVDFYWLIILLRKEIQVKKRTVSVLIHRKWKSWLVYFNISSLSFTLISVSFSY